MKSLPFLELLIIIMALLLLTFSAGSVQAEPAMANPAVEPHGCGYTSGITGQVTVTTAIDKDNHVLCTIDAGSLSGPHSIEAYGISPVVGGRARIIFSFDSAQ
ncbi:MAG: hypothetical protein ACREA4_03855 [Nitrososphaera sp.]